jgi:PAS domain S-box-containing protein
MRNKNSISIEQLIDGLGPIIFRSINIPFGIIDRDHRVLWTNDALAELHRLPADKLIGNICHQVCHNTPEPCDDCPTRSVFQTGKTQIVEKWYQFPGRPKIWGEVHYYPVRGTNGDISAIMIFGFDVTDRKNREEVLKNYSKYLSGKLKNSGSKRITTADGEISITVNLTNRETEILRLLTEGYTNMQIGTLLSISNNTVKTHVNSIFNKMGVNDRTQAAVVAIRQKMV